MNEKDMMKIHYTESGLTITDVIHRQVIPALSPHEFILVIFDRETNQCSYASGTYKEKLPKDLVIAVVKTLLDDIEKPAGDVYKS